jgi:hypothetical protein
MPKPTRYAGVKMNFDAMTDTITNVAGAMIRLVILVLVITQPITQITPVGPRPPPLPPSGPGGSSSADKTGKPLRPLLAEIELLKTLIRDAENKTAAIERELPTLRDRVDKLRQAARLKSGTIDTRTDPPRPTPASPDGDRQVALAPQAHREQTP